MYDPLDYDEKCNQISSDKRMKIRAKRTMSFIQTEKLRNCYDSYKMLQTAKSKEYMSREEIARAEKIL